MVPGYEPVKNREKESLHRDYHFWLLWKSFGLIWRFTCFFIRRENGMKRNHVSKGVQKPASHHSLAWRSAPASEAMFWVHRDGRNKTFFTYIHILHVFNMMCFGCRTTLISHQKQIVYNQTIRIIYSYNDWIHIYRILGDKASGCNRSIGPCGTWWHIRLSSFPLSSLWRISVAMWHIRSNRYIRPSPWKPPKSAHPKKQFHESSGWKKNARIQRVKNQKAQTISWNRFHCKNSIHQLFFHNGFFPVLLLVHHVQLGTNVS